MEHDEIQHKSGNKEENNLKGPHRRISSQWPALLVIGAFLFGISGGYVAWGRPQRADNTTSSVQSSQNNNVTFDIDSLAVQINPVEGYDLGVSYGDLGPQVLAAGGID